MWRKSYLLNEGDRSYSVSYALLLLFFLYLGGKREDSPPSVDPDVV